MSIMGIRSFVLEVAESVALLSAQRNFAGKDFPKGPVDAVDSFGNDTNQVLIFGDVCGKGNGGQGVSDVMVHFGNYLHSGGGEAIVLAGNVG